MSVGKAIDTVAAEVVRSGKQIWQIIGYGDTTPMNLPNQGTGDERTHPFATSGNWSQV